MKSFTLRRSPALYAATSVAVMALHAAHCYPAAVSRGHPPLAPLELIAIFVAPLWMLVPPFFDDAQSDASRRSRRAAWVAAGFCVIWGVTAANLNDARPHIGHLAGLWGILRYAGGHVMMHGLFWYLPAAIFFYFLDGCAIGFWSLWRDFSDERTTKRPSVHIHGLMLLVAIAAVAFVDWRWLVEPLFCSARTR